MLAVIVVDMCKDKHESGKLSDLRTDSEHQKPPSSPRVLNPMIMNPSMLFSNTMRMLSQAPTYASEEPDMAREDWFKLWEPIVDTAKLEVRELIEVTKRATPYPLLRGVQHRAFGSGSSYLNIGEIKIIPDEKHLERSGNRTVAAEKRDGSIDSIRNLYLEISLFRASDILYHQARTRTRLPHHVRVHLHIAPGPEMLALRQIQQNWRGLVDLLLEDLPIEASIVQSNSLSNSSKVKGPLRIIDYVVDPAHEAEENYLELGFLWGSRMADQDAIRAFQTLAILFTCIQQGSHAPRSKKRQILKAWMGLSRKE